MCEPKLELDYYAILELASTATVVEIRGAYKRLALLRHPDKHGGSCAAFQELDEAYKCLSDAFRRGTYDIKHERIKTEHERRRTAEKAEMDRKRAAEKAAWERREADRIFLEKLEKGEAVRRAREMVEKEKERQWAATEATWQSRIGVLRAEVEPLEKQSQEWSEKERERNARPGWFGGWFKAVETEEEKLKKEQDRLQGLAGERIRQVKLARLKEKLKHLETEYERFVKAKREALEEQERVKAAEALIAREQQLKEKREKLAKALKEQRERELREAEARKKEEEERSKKEQEERLKRERLDRERREKWRREEEARQKQEEERLKKEKEEREKERREWEERIMKQREEQEKARREKEILEQARRKKEEEKRRDGEIAAHERRLAELKRQRDAGGGVTTTSNRRSNKTGQQYSAGTTPADKGSKVRSQAACRHTGFWPKINGPNQCSNCHQDFYSFILECPGCKLKACAACRKQLRR